MDIKDGLDILDQKTIQENFNRKNGKTKKIILFITVVFLFNCKDKAQENHIRKEINQKEVNFDTVLKCSDYSYDENYFVTTDYGCIYKQNGNNYRKNPDKIFTVEKGCKYEMNHYKSK